MRQHGSDFSQSDLGISLHTGYACKAAFPLQSNAWVYSLSTLQEDGMTTDDHSPVPLFPTAISTIPGHDSRGRRYYAELHLEIACSGSGKRALRVGRREFQVGTAKGMIEIYQEGYEIANTRWQGVEGECIAITFPRASIERLLRGDARPPRAATAHGVFDGQIARLGYELAQACRKGMPNGALYSEGISIALFSLLARSQFPAREHAMCHAGLSVGQKKMIVDLIAGELGRRLAVERMASLLEMSAYQFSRRFNASFGMSPHQYIMQRRLDAAVVELQGDRSRPISEIALALGFSSQAHLTSMFSRYLGTTPARCRK
ncbi:MAG: helix-turn-helix transcriptional regulator [Burkholderiaceae bacterium]